MKHSAGAVLVALAFAASPAFAAMAPPSGPSNSQAQAGKAFLAQNARAEGVRTTRSGLQYSVLKAGAPDGAHPGPNDTVVVNYEVALLSGQVIDSSYARGQPDTFPMQALVNGWVEALELMRPGDEWRVWLPPQLAYGRRAKGPIPADSVLVFRLELVAIRK